jgi:hypothetical protein
MADISYTRTFTHNDWIDNQDVVQAGGEAGFNQKFHGLEAELDKISTTFGAANTAINNIQRVNFLQANPPITLGANSTSTEFQVDLYDRTNLPPNVEKVYFPILVFVAGSTRVFHTIIYRQAPNNKIAVSIQFFNADPATQAQFAFRVLIFATQSS